MQASVEELGGLERRLTVQVPAETVDKQVRDRLLSLSRKARIDGFRPGKVPVKVVKRMFGSQVRQEVLGEILQSSFDDALKQQSLRVAGTPKVEPVSFEEGKNLEYKATFEVFPEFQPQAIDGVEIRRPLVEIVDSDIDKMLETLREQRAEWRDVERPAADKDRLKIDFVGRIDGEPFDNGSGQDVDVVIGSGAMIPGFEDRLRGQTAGASLEFPLTFPADYPAAEVAAKEAVFSVEVKSVAEPVLPELDEEFLAAFGVDEGGVDRLRELLRDNMQRELRQRIAGDVKQQVMEALLQRNPIGVPTALVNEEIDGLAKEAQLPDSDADQTGLKQTLFKENAERRVRLGLIVSRLIASNNLEIDNSRLQAKLTEMAASYDDPDEFVTWYRQNPQAMSSLRTLVLEEQVVDWLLEKANIVDQPNSFDGYMRRPPQAAGDSGDEQ